MKHLFLCEICSLPFLTAHADKGYFDPLRYDAVNSSNVTAANNSDGSVILTLTDPVATGYVLFNGIMDFSGWEKVFFTVIHSETPNGAFVYTIADSADAAFYDNSAGGNRFC
jgi:hypothetical protein